MSPKAAKYGQLVPSLASSEQNVLAARSKVLGPRSQSRSTGRGGREWSPEVHALMVAGSGELPVCVQILEPQTPAEKFVEGGARTIGASDVAQAEHVGAQVEHVSDSDEVCGIEFVSAHGVAQFEQSSARAVEHRFLVSAARLRVLCFAGAGGVFGAVEEIAPAGRVPREDLIFASA